MDRAHPGHALVAAPLPSRPRAGPQVLGSWELTSCSWISLQHPSRPASCWVSGPGVSWAGPPRALLSLKMFTGRYVTRCSTYSSNKLSLRLGWGAFEGAAAGHPYRVRVRVAADGITAIPGWSRFLENC